MALTLFGSSLFLLLAFCSFQHIDGVSILIDLYLSISLFLKLWSIEVILL